MDYVPDCFLKIRTRFHQSKNHPVKDGFLIKSIIDISHTGFIPFHDNF